MGGESKRSLSNRFRWNSKRGLSCWDSPVILDHGGVWYCRLRPERMSIYVGSMPQEALEPARQAAMAAFDADRPGCWEAHAVVKCKGNRNVQGHNSYGHGNTPEAAVLSAARAVRDWVARQEVDAVKRLANIRDDLKRADALLAECERAATEGDEQAAEAAGER